MSGYWHDHPYSADPLERLRQSIDSLESRLEDAEEECEERVQREKEAREKELEELRERVRELEELVERLTTALGVDVSRDQRCPMADTRDIKETLASV